LNWIECHHHQKSSQKNKASCYVPESQATIKVTQVNQDSCALSVCHSVFMIQESLQFKPNFYPTPRPQGVAPPKASCNFDRGPSMGILSPTLLGEAYKSMSPSAEVLLQG
jgi:hypothetical protein